MIKVILTAFVSILLLTQISVANEKELIVKMFKSPLKDQMDINKKISDQYKNCKIEDQPK